MKNFKIQSLHTGESWVLPGHAGGFQTTIEDAVGVAMPGMILERDRGLRYPGEEEWAYVVEVADPPTQAQLADPRTAAGWIQRHPVLNAEVRRGQVVHLGMRHVVVAVLVPASTLTWDVLVLAGRMSGKPPGATARIDAVELQRAAVLSQQRLLELAARPAPGAARQIGHMTF